jgi:NTP pyrophosphatase (non-canonical NTP hydrolase)
MSNKYSFQDYQEQSKKTAVYPSIGGIRVVYPTLGLAGETGEVVEKIKKIFRDNKGKFEQEELELIKKELGDVLWYLTQIATDLGISLEDVAKHNIEKLYSRFDRGVIKGSGDTR